MKCADYFNVPFIRNLSSFFVNFSPVCLNSSEVRPLLPGDLLFFNGVLYFSQSWRILGCGISYGLFFLTFFLSSIAIK